jgi:hypothetical protein
MSDTVELDEGDFVYQPNLELFLVVTGETENTYKFAAHGWREIDKTRVDEYLSHKNAKMSNQDAVIENIENEGSDEVQESFELLLEMFNTYSERDFDEQFPHENFVMDDT